MTEQDGILLTREQLESWANYPGEPVKLSDETVARLAEAIPNSSIPEAIAAIVSDALGITWCQFCHAELYDFEDGLYARYPAPGTASGICPDAPDDGTYPAHEA